MVKSEFYQNSKDSISDIISQNPEIIFSLIKKEKRIVLVCFGDTLELTKLLSESLDKDEYLSIVLEAALDAYKIRKQIKGN